MRGHLDPVVEARRTAGDPGSGPYGRFAIVCPHSGRTLHVIASDGRDWAECGLPGDPWEHVSASAAWGTPTWAEMCWLKGLFWSPEEWVIQYHPAESDYVNIHEGVLHLWKPVGAGFPTPPKATV